MKLIFRSIKKYKWAIALAIFLKLVGTMAELTLPYILEHMIDDIVPLGDLKQVILWGALMFVAALLCRPYSTRIASAMMCGRPCLSRQSTFPAASSMNSDCPV